MGQMLTDREVTDGGLPSYSFVKYQKDQGSELADGEQLGGIKAERVPGVGLGKIASRMGKPLSHGRRRDWVDEFQGSVRAGRPPNPFATSRGRILLRG